MNKQVALVYTDDYLKYDFGPSHPLRPVRVKLFYKLLEDYNLIGGKLIQEFKVPDTKIDGFEGVELEKTLKLVHDLEYVDFVKRVSEYGGFDEMNEGRFFNLGAGDNPTFPGMYQAAAVHVNSTVYSCDLVMSGKAERTFSPGGGFHHALKRKASGFCIFNDCAIGIFHLLERYNLKRVMYIDIDAHHSDGVQWSLYTEPRALKLSIHQDGRTLFPGTGFTDEIGEGFGKGYNVNLPVPPGTYDEAYLYGFREIVPPLAKAFNPEVIIAQLGADTHFSDPLTNIQLTTKSYIELGKEFNKILNGLNGTKFVGISGGGYDVTATARAWLILFSGIAGFEVANNLPKKWVDFCFKTAGEKPSNMLYDSDQDYQKRKSNAVYKDSIMDTIKQNVSEIKNNIFPVHGL